MAEKCPTCKADAVVSEIDDFINSCATSMRARKDLVLLHKSSASAPQHTAAWLDFHGWCFLHHHIRCPDRIFQIKRGRNFDTVYLSLIPSAVDKHSDFSRLARLLTGTAVGVVMGGGGARGFSHVGMLEALLEADIPIDMIAGVSMGSFVSALWAYERNLPEVRRIGKNWSSKVLLRWTLVKDITYPYLAMFRGRWYNESLRNIFGDVQIEDLFIPYFCVSTDITSLGSRGHVRGTLWRYGELER